MKIIGSDYDGTLNCGGMTREKFAAIRKWREAGNKLGIVTGRSPINRERWKVEHPELEYDFLAFCNGGYIVDENGGVIFEARCDSVPLTELTLYLFSQGCTSVHVDSGQRFVIAMLYRDEATKPLSERDYYCIDEAPEVDYFNQVSVGLQTDEEAAALAESIKLKYSGRLNALLNGVCIDIVPWGVDKAQGMYRVMEHFGASHGDVITVGDNVNDVDMLKEFFSYAMKSGVKAALEAADDSVGDIMEILEKEGCGYA